MNKINIFVTGIGGGIGEQVLKCLAMSSFEYSVFGGDLKQVNSVFADLTGFYVLPSAKENNYIEVLLEKCKQNNIDILFPGSEPELQIISEHRELFKANDILVPLNPQNVIDICLDKNLTMQWLDVHSYNYPKSYKVCNSFDISKIKEFPAVLKPSIGAGGSINTYIARDKNELFFFSQYLKKFYDEYIIQEYVGSCYEEYTVGVLFDLNGEYINSIAVKKDILSNISNRIKIPNTTNKKDLGDFLAISNGISQGEIGKFPEVTKQCVDIAKKLGCRGTVNIQCRYYNNTVFIFEINPRISGTSPMRAMVGFNEPDILIRKHLLGENIIPEFEFRSAHIVRKFQEYII